MKMLHDPVHRAELEKRLAALRPDSPRKWGTMSVDQMLWHVNRTLQLQLGEITAPRERASLPRGVMKFLVLNLPWPKGTPTLAALVAKEKQYDFAQERQRCLELLDRFAGRRLDEEWPENPIFGKVSGADLSRLQAKHLDHHLRQFGV
jgi:DinB family protein